jgi:hypothetical protein
LAKTRGAHKSLTLPRVQLILPTQLKESAESQEVVIEEIDNELDELEGNDYILVSHTDIVFFFDSHSFSALGVDVCFHFKVSLQLSC